MALQVLSKTYRSKKSTMKYYPKFLCTADIHIRNYSKFTKWEKVIPERLQVNLELAKDIVNIADSEDVDAIIIAGDLLDIAISPPMVLNVVDKFLKILSGRPKYQVYLTHGQHDISTKTVDEYLRQLTSLSIFQSDRVRFIHNDIIDIKGISCFFYGWSNEVPELKKADFFIGHNVVRGSRNVLDYIFQTGYDPKELSDNYKFSVIGDIHQSQVFFENVLIPGPPIQNSFKDSPDTGVWVIDSSNWSYKFCPISSSTYSKFYYISDKSDIPKDKLDNHFYQLLPQAKQKKDVEQINTVSLDLWGIIESVVGTVKDSRQDALLEIAKRVYDESLVNPVETRFLPQIVIKSVYIKNFFSVKEFSFDIPEGVVSITGDIGSGKSTLLDAICWGFYGSTTKGKFKDDIVPLTYKSNGDPQVIIDYSISDTSYKIDRTLSSLKFEINGSQLSGSRIADTQKMIEDTVQLSCSEYLCLVYFSQESGSFFGSLSNSQQMSLMTMFLSHQDQYLDRMMSQVSVSYKKYSGEVLKVEGAINNLSSMNEKNTQRYNELKSYQISLRDRQIEALKYSPYKDCPIDIIDLLIQDKTGEAINKYFNIDYDKVKKRLAELKDQRSGFLAEKFNLELESTSHNSEFKQIETNLPIQMKKLKSYKCGVCSECGQSLPIDEEKLTSMVNEIHQLIKRKEEILVKGKSFSKSRQEILDMIISHDEKIKETEELVSNCEDFRSKQQQDITIDQAEMNVLKKSLDEFDSQKEELELQRDSYKELSELYELLHKKVFNDKGIKARCVEYIGRNLSSEVNSLLESIDTNLRLTINTVTYNKSGGLSSGFDVTGNFNGVDINYRNASGGQKMLIDVAAVVSIYNLLSSMYNLPLGIFGFLAMDESIKYLDSKNIDTIKDIVNCIRSRTVFIVSHDEKLSQSISDRFLTVTMENGVSNYKLL